MKLGFIGTGTITAHLVRGLRSSPLADWPVVVTPRNRKVAAALATLPGVSVAPDAQAVLDGSDVAVLAVRPQDGAAALRPLRFAPDRPVISLLAGIPHATLSDWTGVPERLICRAIPLPFVETRAGVTPVFPPLPAAMTLFGALGQALPVTDLRAYDAYAAASALMESYFALIQTSAGWLTDQGLPYGDALAYLRGLFGSLGDTLRNDPSDPAALRAAHSTKGGLNELAAATFAAQGGSDALRAALDAVMRRING